jgi:hypothetical protein
MKFRGWRYEGKSANDLLVKSVTVKPDSIVAKGSGGFILEAPQQGGVAVKLTFIVGGGTAGNAWCADAPAKTSGKPPSTARNDRPGLFIAQPRTPPPTGCPR